MQFCISFEIFARCWAKSVANESESDPNFPGLRVERCRAAPKRERPPGGSSDPRSGGVWGQYLSQRFYIFSAQIQRERKDYYDQLEVTQKGPLDVTPCISWFLGCLLRAVQGADATLAGVLDKAQFWQRWAGTPLNARQTRVLNRVRDGFEGKLSNVRWAALGECSADTAPRHQRPAGARRGAQTGGWRAQYGVCVMCKIGCSPREICANCYEICSNLDIKHPATQPAFPPLRSSGQR